VTVTLDLLFPHLDDLIQTLADVQRLNEAILQLAVQGKLVPQDPQDEPAGELLKRIAVEKEQLRIGKGIKKMMSLTDVTLKDAAFAISSSWSWVTLDDICYQITDGTHHTPDYVEQGVPFISAKDISGGYINFSDTRFITPEAHENLTQRCKPELGDLLLTKVGTTGIAKLVDVEKEFSIFVSVALLKFPQNEIDGQFLEYVVNSPLVKQQSDEFTMGVGNKNLVLKHIRAFKIPLPPLAEQKRIVAKVAELFAQTSALEAKLRRAQVAIVVVNRAVLHHLHHAADRATFQHAAQILGDHFDLLYTDPRPVTDLRQTILQLAVQGKLVPQDPHDEPAGALLKRVEKEKERLMAEGKIKKEKLLPSINDDEVSFGVPVKWQWIRFGVLAQIQSGYAFKSEWYSSDGIRLVRNVNIGHGSIDWSDTANLPMDKRAEFANFELKENDLLISLDRPIISTGLKLVQVTHNDLPSLLVQRVGRMLFFCDDWIDLDYVKIWFKSSVFLDSIDPGRSNGVPHISQKDVANAPFPLPPLAEQKRIVAKVDELLARCAALERKLGQAQVAGRQLTAAVLQGVVG